MAGVSQKIDPEPNTLGWRVNEALKNVNMKPLDLAGDVDVSERTIYRWINNEVQPRDASIRRASEATNVRHEWLKSGEGEMLAPANGTRVADMQKPAPAEAKAGTQATEVMELDVTTGGGDGGVAIQERPIARYEVDYIPLSDLRGCHPDDAFATRMIGRSMTPELQPNDRIVVQPYPEGAQRIETDAIYVFRIDGEIQVKQLEWKPGKRLVCKALSEAHDGFDLDLSDDGPIAEGDIDFAIIGRVWGHFCLL